MKELKSTVVDEIDLIDTLIILWNGKLIISLFITISFLCGCLFLYNKSPTYESKIFFESNNIPPFFDSQDKAISELYDIFHSKEVFENWSKENNSSISYDDFSLNELIDGFIFFKDEGSRIATFHEKDNKRSIIIKTNNIVYVNDFFNYLNHLNNILMSKYSIIAKTEINKIESEASRSSSLDDKVIKSILKYKRYITSSNEGSKLFNIHHPMKPKKTSPSNLTVLLSSFLLGGIIGCLFILFRNVFRNHKDQLLKL